MAYYKQTSTTSWNVFIHAKKKTQEVFLIDSGLFVSMQCNYWNEPKAKACGACGVNLTTCYFKIWLARGFCKTQHYNVWIFKYLCIVCIHRNPTVLKHLIWYGAMSFTWSMTVKNAFIKNTEKKKKKTWDPQSLRYNCSCKTILKSGLG